MQSVIDEIYFNKQNNKRIEESEEFWNIHEEVENTVKSLKSSLNNEQTEQILKLYSQMCRLCDERGLSGYRQGFKEGLLIATEAFKN